MISDEAYLWFYLPGENEPVVCGIVAFNGQEHVFRYARSYLQRDNAVPLAPPNGTLGSLTGEEHILDDELNSVIRDASPDAWGRNIMLREHANALVRTRTSLGDRFPPEGGTRSYRGVGRYRQPKPLPSKGESCGAFGRAAGGG